MARIALYPTTVECSDGGASAAAAAGSIAATKSKPSDEVLHRVERDLDLEEARVEA
jgi:hypothetical protein